MMSDWAERDWAALMAVFMYSSTPSRIPSSSSSRTRASDGGCECRAGRERLGGRLLVPFELTPKGVTGA